MDICPQSDVGSQLITIMAHIFVGVFFPNISLVFYCILLPLVTFSGQLWAAGGHFSSRSLFLWLGAETKTSLAARQQMWLQVGLL